MRFSYGSLTTSATTADQVVLSFTPLNTTSWKLIQIVGYLQTYTGSEVNLGTVSLKVDAAVVWSARIQHTDVDSRPGIVSLPLGNGITFDGAQVVQVIVTPASNSAIVWNTTFLGQG